MILCSEPIGDTDGGTVDLVNRLVSLATTESIDLIRERDIGAVSFVGANTDNRALSGTN